MPDLIAVVDDEPDIVELVTHHLEKARFKAEGFYDAEGLFEYLKNHRPDLIVLDLMLPRIDGLEVCKILKNDPKTKDIPIIILTAKSTETDRVLGLELGADDYLVKPFSLRELEARIRAVLRRTKKDSLPKKVLEAGKIRLDPFTYEVEFENKRTALTKTEYLILETLIKHPSWVFSREQLVDKIADLGKAVTERTIDTHICHLRKKLGKYGRYLKSVHGLGYKLEIPQ